MRRMKYLPLLSAFLLLAASGCMEENTVTEETETTQSAAGSETETDPVTEPETEPETEAPTQTARGINPLTGEGGYPEEAAGKRPVAVMVNNLRGSYPQYGTSDADVVYEMLVEGGITRLMAVYADHTKVPDIGSVRSSRYYFPKIAAGMDAVYCHWGAEQVHAVETMERLKLDRFDGGSLENSILFYRDPERVGVYPQEHTGYLRGSELPQALEQYGVRTDSVREGTLFSFAQEPRVPSDAECSTVTISFSDSYSSTFSYDAASGSYLMYYGSEPQMDGHTGTQLAYSNVFVLQTQVSFLDGGYLREIALDGGTGYYISNGGMERIRWEKTSDSEPIVCYAADGSELTVNTGKSYAALVGDERPLDFSAQ